MLQYAGHFISKDMNTDNSYVKKYIASLIFKLKTNLRHKQHKERSFAFMVRFLFFLTVFQTLSLTLTKVCLRCKHLNLQVLASRHKEVQWQLWIFISYSHQCQRCLHLSSQDQERWCKTVQIILSRMWSLRWSNIFDDCPKWREMVSNIQKKIHGSLICWQTNSRIPKVWCVFSVWRLKTNKEQRGGVSVAKVLDSFQRDMKYQGARSPHSLTFRGLTAPSGV